MVTICRGCPNFVQKQRKSLLPIFLILNSHLIMLDMKAVLSLEMGKNLLLFYNNVLI